jgi:hypothetical protein
MSQDFIIVPNSSKMPTDKAEQIALILHRSVGEALYRVFQSTAPLSRLTDYSHFFTVSFGDLVAHLRSHPDEFHALLPAESWDGISVVRDGQVYNFREHFRGLIVRSEQVDGIEAAITRWLRARLRNQGLRKLVDDHAPEK